MDFLLYGGKEIKPIYKVMDLIQTDLIGGEFVTNNNFFIRRNLINTKDEIFFLG